MFMKIAVVLAVAFVGIALAAPVEQAKIVKFENESFDDGGYHFYYETSDGQTREETGTVMKIDEKSSVLAVKGFFSYVGADGETYKVDYVADKNGFQPTGDHIPAGPATQGKAQ